MHYTIREYSWREDGTLAKTWDYQMTDQEFNQARDDKMIVESLDYLDIEFIRKQNLTLSELMHQSRIRSKLIDRMIGNLYPPILEREIEMIGILTFIKTKDLDLINLGDSERDLGGFEVEPKRRHRIRILGGAVEAQL